MKHAWIAGVFFLAVTVNLKAQEASEASSLAGVDGFRVVVEDITEDARRLGLSERGIQADVETRLRDARLPIAADTAIHRATWVYVQVIALKNDGVLAYSVDVEFRQPTCLTRDTSKAAIATTWRDGKLGLGMPATAADHINRMLGELLKVFINDFQKAQMPQEKP